MALILQGPSPVPMMHFKVMELMWVYSLLWLVIDTPRLLQT